MEIVFTKKNAKSEDARLVELRLMLNYFGPSV